jgi:hypothetical protein
LLAPRALICDCSGVGGWVISDVRTKYLFSIAAIF